MERPRLSRILVLAGLTAVLIGGLYLAAPARRQRQALEAFSPRSLGQVALLPVGGLSKDAGSVSAASSPEARASLKERKLIRTATISLEVGDYAEAAGKAAAVAAARGGFLSDARSAREPGGREQGTLTLRIPADRFDEAVAELKALGRVSSEDVRTQDVSREYADLETRLSVKRDADARLREILKTRTSDLADLVAAERELSRLIEEAEGLEGERRYYARQVALSAITLELAEPAAFFRDAALAPLSTALSASLPLLSGSAAAMVYAIAAVLPWALAGLLIWKWHRRTRIRRLVRVPAGD